MTREYRILVNYFQDDVPIQANEIVNALRRRFVIDHVTDNPENITPIQATNFILVIGSKWLACVNDTQSQILLQIVANSQSRGTPTILVLIGDTPKPNEDDLPSALRHLLNAATIHFGYFPEAQDILDKGMEVLDNICGILEEIRNRKGCQEPQARNNLEDALELFKKARDITSIFTQEDANIRKLLHAIKGKNRVEELSEQVEQLDRLRGAINTVRKVLNLFANAPDCLEPQDSSRIKQALNQVEDWCQELLLHGVVSPAESLLQSQSNTFNLTQQDSEQNGVSQNRRSAQSERPNVVRGCTIVLTTIVILALSIYFLIIEPRTDSPTVIVTDTPTLTLTPSHTPTATTIDTPTSTLTPSYTPTTTATDTPTSTLTPSYTPTTTATSTPTVCLISPAPEHDVVNIREHPGNIYDIVGQLRITDQAIEVIGYNHSPNTNAMYYAVTWGSTVAWITSGDRYSVLTGECDDLEFYPWVFPATDTPTPFQTSEAGFVYTVEQTGSACAPRSALVRFDNTSKNATSFLWEFGDGITSREVNPSHSYQYDPNQPTVPTTNYSSIDLLFEVVLHATGANGEIHTTVQTIVVRFGNVC